MKFLYFFICIVTCPYVFSQSLNKDFLTISLGSIRHEVITISQNNKINGIATFDVLPEISYSRLFSSHSLLTIGLQNPSLSTKFSINQNSKYEPNEAEFRSLTNKSGYLKLFVAYNYLININRIFSINLAVGPFLTYSKVLGLDDHQITYSSSTSPTYSVFFSTSYEVYKVKRLGAGVLFFTELKLQLKKDRGINIRLGYNKGFINFSENRISNTVNGQFNDSAILYSNGTGFFGSVGFIFPIFKKETKLLKVNSID